MVRMEHITGESLPARKALGDSVAGGSTNVDGVLVIEVTHSAQDSTFARIVRLTEAAQRSRPSIQSKLEKIGTPYSKAVLAVALACMIFGPIFGIPFTGSGGSIYRGFAFLSAAAPCALLMSPLAYTSAIALCSRKVRVLLYWTAWKFKAELNNCCAGTHRARG
jgi:Cd2+/Zn2+-exporting ATPase